MKKVRWIFIVVVLLTTITTIAEETPVNAKVNPTDNQLQTIIQKEIQSKDCITLRINTIKLPLTIKGKNDLETVIVKLLTRSPKGIANLEIVYEILSDELWLEIDWSLLEQNANGLEINIEMPEHMAVVICQAEKDVFVSQIAGLDIKTYGNQTTLLAVNGMVRIRDNGGNLVLKDILGDIWISDLGGTMVVKNVAGFVVIDSDTLLDLKMENIVGDVTISAQQGGLAEIKEIKGNVSVFARAPIKTICSAIEGNLLLP